MIQTQQVKSLTRTLLSLDENRFELAGNHYRHEIEMTLQECCRLFTKHHGALEPIPSARNKYIYADNISQIYTL